MQIKVAGGCPPQFQAKDYTSKKPVYGTMECVEYVKNQLYARQANKLSALELKHEFSESKDPSFSVYPHNCTYLILDQKQRELLVIQGMAKGYDGEGPRGALTLDCYLDLLNIPTNRVMLTKEMIRMWKGEKTVNTPAPRLQRFSLQNLTRVKKRIKLANINGEDSLAGLYDSMPIEEMFALMDFHAHREFNPSTE